MLRTDFRRNTNFPSLHFLFEGNLIGEVKSVMKEYEMVSFNQRLILGTKSLRQESVHFWLAANTELAHGSCLSSVFSKFPSKSSFF